MARHGLNTITKPVILAIENSSMCGSVAIVSDGLCICEYSLSTNITHSKRLLAGIDLIMNESAIDWPQIDAIAISIGPGSFTGIRIGLTTVKGLVMATQKKIIGVNTLEGLASQLSGETGLICPIIDARKKEVYTGFYRNKEWTIDPVSKIISISPEILAENIKEPVVFIGDGCGLYKEVLLNILGENARFASREIFYPRAASIGMLAIKKYKMNDFLNPISASPLYIRKSDAEISIKKSTPLLVD